MSDNVQNVLLIEDNPGDAFFIQHMLESPSASGFRMSTIDALCHLGQALATTDFAIILLDLGLPGSQGLETLHIVKSFVPHIPIVVLTGLDDETLSVQALQHGAQDYLVKGTINRTWLINTLNHSIKRSQILRTLHQREFDLETSNQRLKHQVEEKTSQLIETYEQLNRYQELANFDPLTNVANRRYFDRYLQHNWDKSMRESDSLSLLMIDLDDFKRFNDTYGHLEGDMCLRRVAQSIQSALHRPDDLVARYGGEEFIVLLPDTSPKAAITVAERILTHVRVLAIPHYQSRASSIVTTSIGIGTRNPSFRANPRANPNTLVDEADKALYLAKHEGRDRWSLAQSRLLAHSGLPEVEE